LAGGPRSLLLEAISPAPQMQRLHLDFYTFHLWLSKHTRDFNAQQLTMCFRYSFFNFKISPWSIGWKKDVVLEGKNKNYTIVARSIIFGRLTGALSTISNAS
jgi:hypothetical protein